MTAEAQLELGDGSPGLPGFRLDHLEIYNWGTFDQHVWRLNGGGENILVTGEIGSGKSTLVDALTTLLLPSNRITYNLAAGAGFRERNLASYVLGYYKREKKSDGTTSRAVALRDHQSYSVLKADFYNAAFSQRVVLAQVFFMRQGESQPNRFYVVAEQPLDIATDFANFDGDPKLLKRRLKALSHVKVYDTYVDYASRFRRQLMLKSDQALNLLYQTVSMKSVGNLTEFVREHMLEEATVTERIDKMIANFDNVDFAHAQVIKARKQIEALGPLVDHANQHSTESIELDRFTAQRDAIHSWVAAAKKAMLIDKIATAQAERERAFDRAQRIEARFAQLEAQADQIKKALWAAGGSRIEEIESTIADLTDRRQRASANLSRYNALSDQVDLPSVSALSTFHANREKATAQLVELEEQLANQDQVRISQAIELKEHQHRYDDVDAEIVALENQPSNIPRRSLEIRDALVSQLGLVDEDLPFVGELVQVRDEASEWEGAIERLLHGFALSLLVSDDHYGKLSELVNQTHLRGKLVYFRVTDTVGRGSLPRPARNSVVSKLDIRDDSGFYEFLEDALRARFDYQCAADLNEFRRANRALTTSGQIKGRGHRHEKDDRHAIGDRRRYVLGWSNERKIDALKTERTRLRDEGLALLAKLNEISDENNRLEERRRALDALLNFQHFEEIDAAGMAKQIGELKAELDEIRASSDQIATLTRQLDEKTEQVKAAREQVSEKRAKVVELDTDLKTMNQQLEDCVEPAADLDTELGEQLDEQWRERMGDKQMVLRYADSQGSELRKLLQTDIDSSRHRMDRLAQTIQVAMERFRADFPADADEFDADLAAIGEYRRLHSKLLEDDLPRHEERFRQLLREQTVHDIVLLQHALDEGKQDIEQAISQINASLKSVDYDQSANTYIRVQVDRSIDAEIRQFSADLRSCAAGSLSDDDEDQVYSEARFLEVKALMDRFRGRTNLTSQDERWRAKVTDVRDWFEFSVSERYREDDSEREHYSDSSGKSGGQKEKLAYTILAAALAYQFGLEWNDRPSRSFRFVMIDEAFGRGSDESARYGLELFSRLNLQLLIVTPLQKIHVIEDYISNVGYIHNEGGQNSMLRQLTLDEYFEEQVAHASAK